MTSRIHLPQALGRAASTILLAAMAAAAVTAPTAAADPGTTGAGDEYMRIHMANQKTGSEVNAYWQTPRKVAAAYKSIWQLQTDSAYLTVYAYYCAPDFDKPAAMAVEPTGLEVALYTDRFRVEYDRDCRTFYLKEVATRI